MVGEGEARETETQPPVLSLQEEKQDLANKIFPILREMFPDSDIFLVAKATGMIIMSEYVKNLIKNEEDLKEEANNVLKYLKRMNNIR